MRVQVPPSAPHMKVQFIFGGGKYDDEVRDLAEAYIARVGRYAECRTALIACKAKDEDGIREEESEAMLRAIAPHDFVLLFDERGKELSSEELATMVDRHLQSGISSMVVIVGGAYGVNDAVRVRANFTIAFSRMIFPHQLARVMALEQVYRAYSIVKGSKYHHAST